MAEVADDVDIDGVRVEDVLLGLVERALQARDPANDLVGWGLVHADLLVHREEGDVGECRVARTDFS